MNKAGKQPCALGVTVALALVFLASGCKTERSDGPPPAPPTHYISERSPLELTTIDAPRIASDPPTPPIEAHLRLGHHVEKAVYRIPAPAALVSQPTAVEKGTKLSFAYATAERGGPYERAIFRLTALEPTGDRTILFEDELTNIGARQKVPVADVSTSTSQDASPIIDGDWEHASVWNGLPDSSDTIRFRLNEPTQLTAIAISRDDTGRQRSGIPTKLLVELASDSAPSIRRTIAHQPLAPHQWHLLPKHPADRVSITVQETNDGAPAAIDEIQFSADPDVGALPDQLGRWHDAVVDLTPFAGRSIRLQFELTETADRSGSAARPKTFLLQQPTVSKPRPTGRRNAILISVDTVRSDRLSAYGYTRQTTPFLDSIKRSPGSLWFTTSRSASTWTAPSHMSLLTGLTPMRHGLNFSFPMLSNWLSGKATIRPLDSRITTLPEILRDQGYLTIGISSRGPLKGELGFQRGFDTYLDLADLIPNRPVDYEGELVSKAKLLTEWLERLRDRTFFVFLHTFAAHHPYHRSDLANCSSATRAADCSAYRQRIWPADNRLRQAFPPTEERSDPDNFGFYSDLYDSNLLEADQYIAHVLGELDRLDLLQSTVVAITSDHGESFAEHLPHALDAHGLAFYEEFIRVPLVFLFPDEAPAAQIDTPVSGVDVLPTILEAVGVEPDFPTEGQSLLPLRSGDGGPTDERIIHYQVLAAENTRKNLFVAASRGSMKILANPYNLFGGRHELYDIQRDPREQDNIAQSDPTTSKELLGAIDEQIRESFRGMVVMELSTIGNNDAVEIAGNASFDGATRSLDMATRSKKDSVRASADSKAYAFALTLHNERKILGFEPANPDFELALDFTHLPPECKIRFGQKSQLASSKEHRYRRRDLYVNQPPRAGSETNDSCLIQLYMTERRGDPSPNPASVGSDHLTEEQRDDVIEQMRALGYLNDDGR